MTNPNIAPCPAQLKALHKQLTALQKQVSATETQVTLLRQENNRLEAALAVERAGRDPDALRSARHNLHLVTYKLHRVMKIFDNFQIQRPDINVGIADFVTDDFLREFSARVEAHFARKLNRVGISFDSKPALAVPPRRRSPENDEDVAPAFETQAAMEDYPDSQAAQENSAAEIVPVAAAAAAPTPSMQHNTLVDDSNPAADMVRLLIGSSSVKVYDSPPRVRIHIGNEQGTREAAFFLTRNDGMITATRDFINFNQPHHFCLMTEAEIHFEVEQAPNFLILLMGAIFDFSVLPSSRQTDLENINSPLQFPLTGENPSMEV